MDLHTYVDRRNRRKTQKKPNSRDPVHIINVQASVRCHFDQISVLLPLKNSFYEPYGLSIPIDVAFFEFPKEISQPMVSWFSWGPEFVGNHLAAEPCRSLVFLAQNSLNFWILSRGGLSSRTKRLNLFANLLSNRGTFRDGIVFGTPAGFTIFQNRRGSSDEDSDATEGIHGVGMWRVLYMGCVRSVFGMSRWLV